MIPNYVSFSESGELAERVEKLDRLLESCNICPWDCHVNRIAGETKVCVSGYLPIVSSYAPHFGEEPALSGTHLPKPGGAGNIFFGHCNMRCVYCQNWQISQDFKNTRPAGEISFERLAEILLELQDRGCHNIGFVSPTHFASQVARSVAMATRRGLRLPLVYNTNAYDSLEVLRLLDGIFDVYLPDLKYSENDVAKEYSKIPNYVEHARAAVLEMYRQMGDELVLDDRGLLRRGLVIRLLVLPNDLAGMRETLTWIRDTLSPKVTLSVMSQYYPTHKVNDDRFPLLSRRIRPREYEKVIQWVDQLGFENGWIQPIEAEAASYYRPDFVDRIAPFADARDF